MKLSRTLPLCLLLGLPIAAQTVPPGSPKPSAKPRETAPLEKPPQPLPPLEGVSGDIFAPRPDPLPSPAESVLDPNGLPFLNPEPIEEDPEGVSVAMGGSTAFTPRIDLSRMTPHASGSRSPRRIQGPNPEAGTASCHPLLFRTSIPVTPPQTLLLDPFQGLPVIDGANRPRTDWSYSQLRVCGSLEASPVHVSAYVLAARWIESGKYLALSLGASKRTPQYESITALVPANALPNPLPSRSLGRLQQFRFQVDITGNLVYLSPELPTGLPRLGPWGITVSRLVATDPWGHTEEIARMPLQEIWAPALPVQEGPALELTAFPDPGGPFPGIGKPSSPSPTEPLVSSPFKLAAGLPDWPIVGIPEALLLRR